MEKLLSGMGLTLTTKEYNKILVKACLKSNLIYLERKQLKK
jgi:hypothetical protein